MKMPEIQQSPESILRIQKELQEIEESNAVKEYKFITQQIEEIGKGKINDDQDKFMKLKIEKLQ